jgi:hypothetical protein
MAATPRRSTPISAIITKLLNNPAATKVDDLTFEGSAGAVRVRDPGRPDQLPIGRRELSPEQRKAATANLQGSDVRLAVAEAV